MVKAIFFLFLFVPLQMFSQTGSPQSDTLILDKFFNFVGRQVKKSFAKNEGASTHNFDQTCKLGISNVSMRPFLHNIEYYFVGISLHYKRSTFTIGPKFEALKFNEILFKNPGFEACYQINPLRNHRGLNLFFQYYFGFDRWKDQWNQFVGDSIISGTYIKTIFDHCLGYGLKLNIIRGFFIQQSFGFGISKVKEWFITPTKERHKQTEGKWTQQLRLGVGYKF